jgi:periplasmic protein TonB
MSGIPPLSRGALQDHWRPGGVLPEAMQSHRIRFGGAAGASFAFHGALLLLIAAMFAAQSSQPLDTEAFPASLTFVRASNSGGGGGGGNRAKAPQTPPPSDPAPKPEPAAIPPPVMAVVTSTPTLMDIPGTVTGLSAPVSLAPAGPGGGGTQPGTGAGDGKGPGFGPGSNGNTGGDDYVPGDNVTIPQLVYEKRAAYTPEAVRARIQGIVEIEAVVMADGSVARPRIIRSLDDGLDKRALQAVMDWRFKPGRRRDTNQPVNVIVRIQLTFQLR